MIALSGRAASGKSTVASALEDRGYVRIAFADALKEEVYELFGLRKHDPGGREKLIEWGNHRRRENPDYWINCFAVQWAWADVCGLPIVCDDLRFQREFNYLRSRGVYLVRIVVPPSLRAHRLAQDGLDPAFVDATDPGEVELDDSWPWDSLVANDGRFGRTPERIAWDIDLAARAARFDLAEAL